MPADEPGDRPSREEAAAIEAAASSHGIDLPPGAAGAIARHAQQVREAAGRLNLTSIVEREAMLVRHVLDSLLPLRIWPEVTRCSGEALDLGSGAGYPGLPLAMAGAARRVTLLDATRRKVEFLAEAARVSGTEVRVVWGRAEELAGTLGEQERVWTRAVGPLPVLIELAFGMLRAGGVVVCWKGPEARGDEAVAGEAACRALGGECLGVREYELPDGAGRRTLFAYRRGAGALPAGLPRAPAVIRRRPLALR